MSATLGARLEAILDRDALRFLWRYLAQHRGTLLVFVGGAIVQSLLVLPVLWLVRHAFDVTIPARDVRGLLLIGGGIFLVRAAGSVLSLILRSQLLRVVKGAVTDLRRDLVQSLLHRSREDLDGLDVSQAHTRVVQETERVDRVATVLLSGLLPSLVAALGIAVALIVIDARMVALAVVVAPLIWGVSRWLWRKVQREVTRFQAAFEGFSKGVNFVLRQIDMVRLAAAEHREMERQQARLDDLREAGATMAMTFAVHSQVQRTLIGLAGIAILVVGGIAVANGEMSLGAFITFYVAAGLLNGHVDSILASVPEVIAGNVSLNTLRHMLDDAVPEPYRGREPVHGFGSVSLRNVTFTYGARRILDDVTLTVGPDDNLAIIGDNGAGKSTIVKLIAGLYRPQQGQLRWNDLAYDDIDMQALRRSIGFVQQHASFFRGTVRENLLYGHPAIADAQVERALFLSTADAIIGRLAAGLETPMGELGELLSGGERQRLAIARALVGSPRVLVLDEPTTHLDIAGVRDVMTRLLSLADRPAVLTITHDPAVQAFADTVLRLDAGRLVPVTPHPRAAMEAVS